MSLYGSTSVQYVANLAMRVCALVEISRNGRGNYEEETAEAASQDLLAASCAEGRIVEGQRRVLRQMLKLYVDYHGRARFTAHKRRQVRYQLWRISVDLIGRSERGGVEMQI